MAEKWNRVFSLFQMRPKSGTELKFLFQRRENSVPLLRQKKRADEGSEGKI